MRRTMKMNDMKNISNGGFLISKIQKLGARIFAKILKEEGIEINPGQGRILYALWLNDGIPIQRLAEITALGTSTLTSMLDRMEKDQILVRNKNPEDRRSYLIHLTPKSKKMQERFGMVSQKMTNIYYSGFSQSERALLENQLERIFQNLQDFEK